MTDVPPTEPPAAETPPPPPAPPPAPAAPPPSGPPPIPALADDRQIALIGYILLLIPIIIPVTHIVGLVLAYVNRTDAPDWLKSHYTLQIRTFWIGLLYIVVAAILCVLLIGFILVPLVVVWYIVRLALGIDRLMKRQPYPTPESWTF
ncbi:MAG TPA: DUF4870 domain-containing protein [Caulobacteraceae bacterium]|nr:DUF4870 domain-containing protein [Caulobacteraceae bacterium]